MRKIPIQDVLESPDGCAEIITKKFWMHVFPMPHTSILPYKCGFDDLKNAIIINWKTSDAWTLNELHGDIVNFVREVGLAGMVEIANSVKMTERVCQQFGPGNSGIQEVFGMAAADGVDFPLPPNVLKHLKGFQ